MEVLTRKYYADIVDSWIGKGNIIAIAKATSEEHMRSNIEIFDFSLTEEEMWFLQCMPETAWMGEHPDFAIPAKHSNPDQ